MRHLLCCLIITFGGLNIAFGEVPFSCKLIHYVEMKEVLLEKFSPEFQGSITKYHTQKFKFTLKEFSHGLPKGSKIQIFFEEDPYRGHLIEVMIINASRELVAGTQAQHAGPIPSRIMVATNGRGYDLLSDRIELECKSTKN